ncbi:MAG: hypothetical protein OER88_09030, partial [Planctomycetota bacterium]|nr:hypothetical protein [Planctomycetota bacterium]
TIRTQTLIDREYDLKRAAQAKKNAEHELERHGLSTDEIDAVRKGEPAPGSQRLWRRALEQNGLWGDAEESIHSALSQPARDRPWTIAAIGELSAAGLATSALAQALTASTPLASHFIEVAALLLEGHTLEHVRLLADAGALEPVAVVRAPAGPPDWDVERIHVRVGTRVDAGAAVAELHDGRTMWLRVEPLGEEAALIARAFDERTTVLATPLITNAGPRLNDLRILRLATREGGSGTIAYVAARNAAVARDGVRSWKLRSGLRYLLHVPVARLAQRFVVPASAVTDRGPDRVIYLPDGKTFRAVAVTIEYADDEIAVISNDGAIFANDRMVMTGAFALGLAMQAGTGAVDPHAGHSHD